MRLYLVQHGQALSKDVDPGRPLSSEGEREVRRIARHMNKSGIQLQHIYHSGKMRAHQTAEIFGDELLASGEVEARGGINPDDPVEKFASIIPKLKPGTMVVGHLPFMAKLVAYLVTGKEDPAIAAYKPGSVICLVQDEQKHWQIGWMLRPDCI